MMECNHKDNEGKLDLSVYDGDIDCRRCSINFGRIIKAVEWFNTSDYQEGEIQIRKQFSFLLDLFKAEFEKFKIIVLSDKHRPLSKSDEQHFKLISEVNQAIKKSEDIDQSNINDNGYIGLPETKEVNQNSGINQHFIINNQALKISDLESEVKRLEKIVIGLSERLINLK